MAELEQQGVAPELLQCPSCDRLGQFDVDDGWSCNHGHHFQVECRCSSCRNPLMLLRNCGGQRELFCRQCRRPESRRQASYRFTPKA